MGLRPAGQCAFTKKNEKDGGAIHGFEASTGGAVRVRREGQGQGRRKRNSKSGVVAGVARGGSCLQGRLLLRTAGSPFGWVQWVLGFWGGARAKGGGGGCAKWGAGGCALGAEGGTRQVVLGAWSVDWVGLVRRQVAKAHAGAAARQRGELGPLWGRGCQRNARLQELRCALGSQEWGRKAQLHLDVGKAGGKAGMENEDRWGWRQGQRVQ